MNKENVAKKKWNAKADQYNQWDELGQDEKDALISAEPVDSKQQPTMTLNEVLREISYQQWLVSREEGDVEAARSLLQNLYEMRDKMIELCDE